MVTRRTGSGAAQFVRRIPADVKEKSIGRTLTIPVGLETVRITITESMTAIRFSLRTKDKGEAKVREAQAAAYLEEVWQALRKAAPTALDHRQATALAGDMYRGWTTVKHRTTAIEYVRGVGWVKADVEHDEKEAIYESIVEKLQEQPEGEALEKFLGPIVDRELLKHGIAAVDIQSRPMLLKAFYMALRDAMETRNRHVHGDYSPDPKANRFPEWQDVAPESPPEKPKDSPETLTGMVEAWWREAQAVGLKPATHSAYRQAMSNFVEFLGHDDPYKVTTADVVRYKDHRLTSISPTTGKPRSAKTVKDNDLAGLKAVFQWAKANRHLKANPAEGVTVKVGKKRKVRSQGFTDEEARAILSESSKHVGSSWQLPQTTAALRWIPWLSAYTGARVGELCQLRKQDVRKVAGEWVIHITPEAGTVKSNEARDVPIHPHLVEQGFLDFVNASPDGYLFIRVRSETTIMGTLEGLKNRLIQFTRGIVKDPNVAPNHGWRHRFKTVGMEAGVSPRILDAIQGHAAASVADAYGETSVKTMAAAIEKIPKIEV